jgi:hypothetical protein
MNGRSSTQARPAARAAELLSVLQHSGPKQRQLGSALIVAQPAHIQTAARALTCILGRVPAAEREGQGQGCGHVRMTKEATCHTFAAQWGWCGSSCA